jgi:hypothetical protein
MSGMSGNLCCCDHPTEFNVLMNMDAAIGADCEELIPSESHTVPS